MKTKQLTLRRKIMSETKFNERSKVGVVQAQKMGKTWKNSESAMSLIVHEALEHIPVFKF